MQKEAKNPTKHILFLWCIYVGWWALFTNRFWIIEFYSDSNFTDFFLFEVNKVSFPCMHPPIEEELFGFTFMIRSLLSTHTRLFLSAISPSNYRKHIALYCLQRFAGTCRVQRKIQLTSQRGMFLEWGCKSFRLGSFVPNHSSSIPAEGCAQR